MSAPAVASVSAVKVSMKVSMFVDEYNDDIKAQLVTIGCSPLQVKQRWNKACSDAWKAVDPHERQRLQQAAVVETNRCRGVVLEEK